MLDRQHPKRLALLYFDDIVYELDANKKTRGKWFTLDKVDMLKTFDKALVTVTERFKVEEPISTIPFASVPPLEEDLA